MTFGVGIKGKEYPRQFLKREQVWEELEYFNYWLDPHSEFDDILNPNDIWEQDIWENENIEYYRNKMGRRDLLEDSQVYNKNSRRYRQVAATN